MIEVKIDHLYLTRGGGVALVDWQQLNGYFKVSPYYDPCVYLVDWNGLSQWDGKTHDIDLIVDLGSRYDEDSHAARFLAALDAT